MCIWSHYKTTTPGLQFNQKYNNIAIMWHYFKARSYRSRETAWDIIISNSRQMQFWDIKRGPKTWTTGLGSGRDDLFLFSKTESLWQIWSRQQPYQPPLGRTILKNKYSSRESSLLRMKGLNIRVGVDLNVFTFIVHPQHNLLSQPLHPSRG